MTTPRISVLIDTYNQERYIEQAIMSVLEQDFPAEEIEILVVDDGSTDRTPEIVGNFVPRVRYLRKENGGQASVFNTVHPRTSWPYCFLPRRRRLVGKKETRGGRGGI